MCRATGVVCEGFVDEIRWMSDRKSQPSSGTTAKKANDPEKQGPRRHLYTEKSRVSMSDALSADLVSGSIDASLAEIETRSRDTERPSQGDIVVGPFAVLDFSLTEPKSASRAHPTDETTVANDVILPSGDTLAEGASGVSPALSQESIAYMNDLLQWSDILSLDPQLQSATLSGTFDLGDWLPLDLGTQAPMLEHNLLGEAPSLMDDTAALYHCVPGQDNASKMVPPVDSNPPDVLADAHYLLRHFQDHVISRMMAVPLDQKSPWKILNVPSAVVTYSDITFLGSQNITHARLANLYCLLACSALHLTVNPSMRTSDSTERWKPVAEYAYHLAKDHMQMSLKHETQEPKKAKYKDQLMAICALTEFAILSSQQQDARCYMIDAERLLRLRGLPKQRISQKARLLHHTYTWLRIVGESTYALHNYTPSDAFMEALKYRFRYQKVENTQAAGYRTSRLDDFLRLDRRPSDSDLDIDEPKEDDVGLYDIHLQDSRKYPATLYSQIYGVSETWLSLVSQTTRLANVMETFRVAREMRQGNNASLEAWEALHRRSARLESMVCTFASRRTEDNICDSTNILAKSHGCLLQALNSALVIFFYRRIRQVHPAILESQVDKVISSLNEFDVALVEADHTGPGTVWPLFIAGCEATTPERRQSITLLLDKGEARCGFSAYHTVRDVMNQVWDKQDAHFTRSRGETFPTWLDVVKSKQIWPILA
ncbi:transcriptional regulator family: Fungal Specific TF [Aspergillus niger]|nr:transcriptional regulator family: Fungal Specific TF [Aspergillus niger]KAI2831985.1 transcriptional regulator family: Fungal Specific TF [Aspergillus niger]KAI2836509.1 transcriptional regulator family: Fungal Specific TF [Aspergillus niger]KAI2872442.1 transcriptional regulator family: Fungal Specific TF [Aspergillus niger]KAI2884073.1 transcriptional regulator family: Fungal Specific TF [Aspergillus niger]